MRVIRFGNAAFLVSVGSLSALLLLGTPNIDSCGLSPIYFEIIHYVRSFLGVYPQTVRANIKCLRLLLLHARSPVMADVEQGRRRANEAESKRVRGEASDGGR
jgi:hypothetical protein